MRKVLLHLGLHKTGTTAAQSFLFENRKLIWPDHALVLPYRTRKSGLASAATRHSVYGTPGTLTDFRELMRDFLAELDFGNRRGLILSEENFSGKRPSRNPALGYDTAPDLAACLVDLVRDRFEGEEVDITVYLSLRQRELWLRSLWAHDLRRTRLVHDFDAYSARLASLPSLNTVAEKVRAKLSGVSVQTEWLESLQTRHFGAGAPFADFLDLPPDLAEQLVGPTHLNKRLPERVLTELLTLNRSGLDELALISQKAALVKRAQNDLIGTA